MSLNEERDVEDPSKLLVPQNVQDELVRIIHMSLNNIATQVDNLNKHAEGILGALSKEVDKVSCRYDTLQERVIQLNNNIPVEDPEKEFPLQAKKSKSSQSACIQTDIEYPSSLLPTKICETHDASVQTSPLYMSTAYCHDNPQVVPVYSFQEDRENVQISYYQDDSDDLAIPYCQDNEQDVVIPFCGGSDQGLAATGDFSYYFKACEEEFVAGVNEQVQERFRKKNQHVNHSYEPKGIHQITWMKNDITMGHTPPTCIEISHSHVNPSTIECSAFSSYPINEISKALTQAVGKVLASPPHPQRKDVKNVKNLKSYVRYGVGKREMNPKLQVQICLKPEVSVSQKPPVTPPSLPHDWLTVLKDSTTEFPTSTTHSQTQFSSPALGTSEATRINCLQTRPGMSVKTTEEDNDDSLFPRLPPECLEIVEDDIPEEDNTNERIPLMSSSPILLQKTETEGKGSDLFAQTSFVQSPSSLECLSSKPLFPQQSQRLSASNSPRPTVLVSPRFSHQPQTKYICPTYSKTPNAALLRHSTLETYQSSSFLQASVHSARCQSAYSPKHSVSSRHFDTQSTRFSIPSSENIYIDQSTEKLVLPSSQSSSLKSTKPFTLQSLFSFPKSASPGIPNPQTLSLVQYSADPVSPEPKRPSVFNKEKATFLDSIRKGVLLQKTEEHCILKAQIEISKK